MKEIMIGEVKVNGRQSKSLAWKFFKKLDQIHAQCNYCQVIYNYTSLSHLRKHAKKKHPDAFKQMMKQDQALCQEENNSPTQHEDEISITSWPDVEVCLQTDDAENGEESSEEEDSSDIWSLFTRIDDTHAECNLCQIKLSFEHSIAGLTMHKEVQHSEVLLKCSAFEDEPSRIGSCDGKDSLTPQIAEVFGSNDKPAAENSSRGRAREKSFSVIPPTPWPTVRKKHSATWQYFTVVDTDRAQCKFCLNTVSYKAGSVSNMKRHVTRLHPSELEARANDGRKKDVEENADDNSANALSLQPQDESSISDVEEESEEETLEEISKTTFNAQSSDQTSQLCSPKRVKMDSALHEEDRTIKYEIEDESMAENLQSSQCQYSASKVNSATRKIPRSSMWKVFTKLANGCSECKICGLTMSKKSSISNLLRHVKRVHPSFKDLNNSGVQKKVEEFKKFREVRSPNRGPRRFVPVIHTFNRKTESTSTQTECSDSNDTGCLLSERLVNAVEEGNHLLRGVLSAVERQSEAFNRLAACLEGLQQAEKKDV